MVRDGALAVVVRELVVAVFLAHLGDLAISGQRRRLLVCTGRYQLFVAVPVHRNAHAEGVGPPVASARAWLHEFVRGHRVVLSAKGAIRF